MEKYVVVIGGVLSGVGKGIATASIGRILTEYGYKTTAIKIDPYINYNAGTLSVTEHGEIWVTNDGGEIDQDLGSYERFLGADIPKTNNMTTGQIYKTIIERERKGKYLGETVQFIPHVPDEIKSRIRTVAKGYNITLIEIGGTVGDFENVPFLFAIKGIEREIGKENLIYVLITYMPVPSHIGEMKTKPTQQAIKSLQENGIIPDIILCRGREPLDDIRRKKIEIYANIKREFIISAPDIELVYDVPINFEREGLGRKILTKLYLEPKKEPNWSEWNARLNKLRSSDTTLIIGIVSKDREMKDLVLHDIYISINEALIHAGSKLGIKPKVQWINPKEVEQKGPDILKGCDGIIIPTGFDTIGIEGKIISIQYVRENKIPFLGICLGMQLAAVEYARNVVKLKDAHTQEIDPTTPYPIVTLLPFQQKAMNGSVYEETMRLGAYAAYLKPGTLVYELYKEEGRIEKDMQESLPQERVGKSPLYPPYEYVIERHRHRYDIAPQIVKTLEEAGLVFSGYHYRVDDVKVPEFLELPGHPFFVATQAHPEFRSRFLNPSPLFLGFLKASIKQTK